jgi:ribosomal protein S18 acetylase RimI-like enzyme
LSDADRLQTSCWPDRAFQGVYRLVQRAVRHAEEQRGLGLVVAEGSEVRGYGQFVIWPTCAEVSDVVVVEGYRGRGYGTALIQTLVRAAVRMGVEDVEIGAAFSNPRAVALYRRLGFEDSHTLLLDLDSGKERVLFLRLAVSQRAVERLRPDST